MWDAAIEHRKQHENFDAAAFLGTYNAARKAKHSTTPMLSREDFHQVQRTCVESYLAKRKFHVRLSTRYLYRLGLAYCLLNQGDLQVARGDAYRLR